MGYKKHVWAMTYDTPICFDNFVKNFFGAIWAEIPTTSSSVSINGIPHFKPSLPEYLNQLPHWITMWHFGLRKVPGIVVTSCVYSLPHPNTYSTGTFAPQQTALLITISSWSYLTMCLCGSIWLLDSPTARVRKSPTPSVIFIYN